MTHLSHLMDEAQFAHMVQQGYIRVQRHPRLPYSIANYTEKAVYDKAWNDATLQSRGLIFDFDGNIVARPFRKFFNHQEVNAPFVPLDAPVVVTDKMDGSLGVLYPTLGGGYAVATRGSFQSEQALHATALFAARYQARFQPLPGITYLFEIIYPHNRIVVDYGNLDDLVLLGAVDIATGRSITPEVIQRRSSAWPGPVTETFTYQTFGQALAAQPRPGKEGLVVHDLTTDERVKLKQEDYITLHRLVTGLTSRRVHEAMMAGIDIEEYIQPLPDEFHDWVRDVADRIAEHVRVANATIDSQWKQVIAECEGRSAEAYDPGMPESLSGRLGAARLSVGGWPATVSMGLEPGAALSRDQRALFASIAKNYSYAWALFARLDGKDYQTRLLKMAEPEEIETPQGRTFTEATA